MSVIRIFIIVVLTFSFSEILHAQDKAEPVLLKVNRIIIDSENNYAFYVPTFEFHVFFQKRFDVLRSAVTADYDYLRQDMGFGMSHAFHRYEINPGINIDDNLYFREVFSDSTGIWRRRQSITPFLLHELNDNSGVGVEFKFQREWSPRRRMGTKIVSDQDRSIKCYYYYQKGKINDWKHKFYYLSLERSYRIFKGEFNYLLLETVIKYSTCWTNYMRYKTTFSYRGNITPQNSPIIFLGGHSNLIGYRNDEFWGMRVFSSQNLFAFNPFPEFRFSIKKANFRRLSLLYQIDIGRVSGAANFKEFKPQNKDLKMGLGVGFGVNTDLPNMPTTDIYFLITCPRDDISDIKYYAGFGGWIH